MRARYGIFLALALALGTIGTLGTLGLLMCTAPAALLERLMPEQLPVRFAACTGKLLRSGACQVFLRGDSGWSYAGVVSYRWGFKPDGGLHLVLQQDGRRAGMFRPSFEGWQATDIDIRTPTLLSDALRQNSIAAWQLTGRQVISTPAIACDWRASDCAGRVRVDVIDLVIGQVGRDPVGSYGLDFKFVAGGRLIGRLSTLSGALVLDGQFEKSPAAGMRISGRAKLGAGINDGVRQLLTSIARREDANTFAYAFP